MMPNPESVPSTRRTMSRSLLAAVVTLLLACVVSAAAPQVRLEFWTISLQPFFTTYVRGLIAQYEREHPGTSVRWIDVPAQAIDQKLLAAIAGGQAPDVVNLNTEGTLRMAQSRALVDTDAAVPADARARYFANIWGSTRYLGHAYGIPWYVVPNVLAYNQSVFRRAGLDPAKPPASEDAFVQAATTVKQRTGIYGFMPNVDGIRFLRVFQEDGLAILSPDRRHAVFNSQDHVRLLDRYVALFKRDLFPSDTFQRGYLGATERYAAGQLAMLTTGPQFLLRVRSDSPDVYRDTAVAPYPLGRGRVLDLPTMDLVVPLASRRRAEAVQFALFVTNDQNQLAFSHLVVIFPSTQAAARDPYFTRGGASPEERARAIAARELGTARDLTVVVPHSDEMFRTFREAIESAFLGRMTPQQALDWAVKEWDAKL
jgi:putative chitobiose transport system substrate-binding protein